MRFLICAALILATTEAAWSANGDAYTCSVVDFSQNNPYFGFDKDFDALNRSKIFDIIELGDRFKVSAKAGSEDLGQTDYVIINHAYYSTSAVEVNITGIGTFSIDNERRQKVTGKTNAVVTTEWPNSVNVWYLSCSPADAPDANSTPSPSREHSKLKSHSVPTK